MNNELALKTTLNLHKKMNQNLFDKKSNSIIQKVFFKILKKTDFDSSDFQNLKKVQKINLNRNNEKNDDNITDFNMEFLVSQRIQTYKRVHEFAKNIDIFQNWKMNKNIRDQSLGVKKFKTTIDDKNASSFMGKNNYEQLRGKKTNSQNPKNRVGLSFFLKQKKSKFEILDDKTSKEEMLRLKKLAIQKMGSEGKSLLTKIDQKKYTIM